MDFQLPSQPHALAWQNTVVDIEATSRYGGSEDKATVSTTLCLLQPAEGTFTIPVPGPIGTRSWIQADGATAASELIEAKDERFSVLRGALGDDLAARGADPDHAGEHLERAQQFEVFQLQLTSSLRLLHIVTSTPVLPSEGGFRFGGMAPAEFTALPKGSDFSMLVMLPRAVEEGEPKFRVRLERWAGWANAVVFGQGGVPPIAGRSGVAWYDRKDPDHFALYLYDELFNNG